MEVLNIVVIVILLELVIYYLISSYIKYSQGVPNEGIFNPLKKYTDYYPHIEYERGYDDAKKESDSKIDDLQNYIIQLQKDHKKLLEEEKTWLELKLREAKIKLN